MCCFFLASWVRLGWLPFGGVLMQVRLLTRELGGVLMMVACWMLAAMELTTRCNGVHSMIWQGKAHHRGGYTAHVQELSWLVPGGCGVV